MTSEPAADCVSYGDSVSEFIDAATQVCDGVSLLELRRLGQGWLQQELMRKRRQSEPARATNSERLSNAYHKPGPPIRPVQQPARAELSEPLARKYDDPEPVRRLSEPLGTALSRFTQTVV